MYGQRREEGLKTQQWKPVIEGLLFAAGEDGLRLAEIADIIGEEKKVVRQLLQEMQTEWKEAGRGIQIVKVGRVYQLTTLPEHHAYFEQLAAAPSRSQLSRAALETLAIVAYRQPIIRADIEEIRGVKSEKALAYLKRRGLIREMGRAETVGRPILYGTTPDFLQYFGLSRLEELPPADSIFQWAEWEQERQELYERLGVSPQQEEATQRSTETEE